MFSQQVVKVGHHVQGNLDLLSLLWDLTPASKPVDKNAGWVDLGVLARSRGLIPYASLSLTRIAEEVIAHTIESSEEIRCSNWCQPDLSDKQKAYATQNAWLSLHIFKAITTRPPAGARLSKIGLPGEKVTLRNGSVAVAQGSFVEQMTQFPVCEQDSTKGYISLSRTKRALVRISKIVAPSFISRYHHQTLEELGPIPFDMVVDLASLVSREDSPESISRTNPISSENHGGAEEELDGDDGGREVEFEPSSSETSDSESESDDEELGPATNPDPSPTNGESDDEFESYMDPDLDAYIATHPEGPDLGVPHPLVQPTVAPGPQPTHTFQDIFHLMERLNKHINKDHSLAKQFSRVLRDAMLVPDKIDKARVEAVLKKQNITWDQAVRSKPEWVWARVRRYIPSADVLIPILSELFKSHANLKCSKKGFKLFTAESHKAAKLMMEDIRQGWASDPPGVAMFNRVRIDKHGLSIWHCIRGTSGLEGGVHHTVRSKFGSLGASVELTVALLSDYCYRKNLEVSISKRYP